MKIKTPKYSIDDYKTSRIDIFTDLIANSEKKNRNLAIKKNAPEMRQIDYPQIAYMSIELIQFESLCHCQRYALNCFRFDEFHKKKSILTHLKPY